MTLTDDSYTGGEAIHTGQLFFDPDIDTAIQATSPYSENTTRESCGPLTLTALGESVPDGYKATLTVGVSTA
ncbi:hypothetical protein [Streptomyces cyaneus]|uniref:hypothetical protein n=1 Tax=Streptomyces cyaneus TaxID=1904 RepID=UPI003CCC6709